MSPPRSPSTAWLPAGVWLLASACGPGGATPIPEPPPAAFDLNGVDQGVLPVNEPTTAGDAKYVTAAPGTVPAGATVRITNLDQTTMVYATTADENGSFLAVAVARAGEELRFEWTLNGQHSEPADGIVVEKDALARTIGVRPSPRFECLKVTPSYALGFFEEGAETLEVRNDCDAPLTISNPRPRLTLGDFSLDSTLPLELAAGATSELRFDFSRSADGLREDVWFVDVTRGAETLRYPFTLRTE